MAFFIKDNPARKEAVMKNEPGVPVKEILRNRNFYLLGIGSMCSIGAVGGVNQHLKLYLRDIDFSQSAAAQIMSLVLLSSLAGESLWDACRLFPQEVRYDPDLPDRWLFNPFVACPRFSRPDVPFCCIIGIGLGGDYMIIPLMAGDLFGIKTLGRVMGIILVADGIAESLSPMMEVALYNDAFKSYAFGFTVLICIALTGALIV